MKANIYFSTELTSDAEAESEIWQVRDISPDIRAGIWMLSLLFVNLKALPKDQSTLVHQLLVTIYIFFFKTYCQTRESGFFCLCRCFLDVSSSRRPVILGHLSRICVVNSWELFTCVTWVCQHLESQAVSTTQPVNHRFTQHVTLW